MELCAQGKRRFVYCVEYRSYYMKEGMPYEETWIFIGNNVYLDSQYVGWMRERERSSGKSRTVKYRGRSRE